MKTIKSIILVLTIAISTITTAQVKIGTNPTQINESAELEIESSDKGILLPRLNIVQRESISNPAEGLLIYNYDSKCLEIFNGSEWLSNCGTATQGGIIPGLAYCENKPISKTSCGGQNSIEYEGKTYPLVEINGQCWFAENLDAVPSNFDPAPELVAMVDSGWHGYYNNDPTNGENGNGRLYQWSAAMNGSTEERAQGVCPEGWHVPSDCEWMFLEYKLGMDISELELTNNRNSGNVGTKLSPDGTTGFNSKYLGYWVGAGFFSGQGEYAQFTTSTHAGETSEGVAKKYIRTVQLDQSPILREGYTTSFGNSLRCLKN